MLRSANLRLSVFLFFYYNCVKLVKLGSFATKFCAHSATDNVNKCCKFGYCMISIFVCVHILSAEVE